VRKCRLLSHDSISFIQISFIQAEANMKKMLIVCVGLLQAATTFGHSSRQPIFIQEGATSQPRAESPAAKKNLLGEVASIDQSTRQLSLKTDHGEMVVVHSDDRTTCLRLSPGETNLQKAIKISFSEIAKGDRMYVRARPAGDGNPVVAQQLIVMTKADIEQKRVQDRQQWLQRGIAGVVTQVNAEKNEILIQVREGAASKPVVVGVTNEVRYRRYAPDSISFAEARPSSINELKAGDQLRALGQKKPDGTGFTSEEIVSGSFQTIGGTVTAVNAEAGQLVMTLLGGKQSITVSVKKDTNLRRITPQVAATIVQRSQAKPQGAAQPNQPAAGSGDLQELFDKMPALTLAEFKPGEIVAVYSTKGADPARVTAISMMAGVNNVLSLLQPRPSAAANAPSPTTGLPPGILDSLIGLP
jgi:hypothetical protein